MYLYVRIMLWRIAMMLQNLWVVKIGFAFYLRGQRGAFHSREKDLSATLYKSHVVDEIKTCNVFTEF